MIGIIASAYLIGLLSSVSSLTVEFQNSSFNVSWMAPFTLDVTDSDIDITYCIGVNIATDLVHSECGIITTAFTYSISATIAVCSNYTFTVIPVNLLGNGTQATFPHFWMYTRMYTHYIHPCTVIISYYIGPPHLLQVLYIPEANALNIIFNMVRYFTAFC